MYIIMPFRQDVTAQLLYDLQRALARGAIIYVYLFTYVLNIIYIYIYVEYIYIYIYIERERDRERDVLHIRCMAGPFRSPGFQKRFRNV